MASPLPFPVASLLVFALLVLGGKLLLIACYANATPYTDQWTLAYSVFTPWINGNLNWQELYVGHAEHHILTTRLLDMVLIRLNGGIWNPLLEMVVNACLHTATLVMLICLLAPACPARWRPLLPVAAMLLFVVPAGYANTIIGFQSQIYFVLFFDLVFFWCISCCEPLSAGWWLGLACGVLGFLSFAAGAAAPAIAGGLSLLRQWLGIARRPRDTAASLILLAASGLALAQTPVEATWVFTPPTDTGSTDLQTTSPHAASVTAFLASLYATASWPTGILAPLLQWPLLRFLWRQVKRPPAATHPSWFIFVTGLWVWALIVLISYSRSNEPLLSRYTDFFSIGLLLNLVCLLPGVAASAGPADAAQQESPPDHAHPLRPALLWLGVVVICLAVRTAGEFRKIVEYALPQLVTQEQSIKAYLATGDFIWLTPRRFPNQPLVPRPEEMQAILDIPAVHSILPPNLVPEHMWQQPGWVIVLLAQLRAIALTMLTAACGILLWARVKKMSATAHRQAD